MRGLPVNRNQCRVKSAHISHNPVKSVVCKECILSVNVTIKKMTAIHLLDQGRDIMVGLH